MRRAGDGALAAPFAYVPNEGSASISVIDTATDKVVETLKVGQKPRGIAVSADGKRLVRERPAANALVVWDLASARQVAKVDLGDSPEAIYLSPTASGCRPRSRRTIPSRSSTPRRSRSPGRSG
jgi:YVTN family beta-propeller protein